MHLKKKKTTTTNNMFAKVQDYIQNNFCSEKELKAMKPN